MTIMKRDRLAFQLKSKFNLSTRPAEEFYGHSLESVGLWINDNICKKETDYYDYANGTLDNNKLNDYLESNGWYAEPYDSETIFVWIA